MLGHEVMLRCILGEKTAKTNQPASEEFDDTQSTDDLAKAISEIFES